jgi:ADP-heptose:LPS heptosyltransferase/glycosyltransferase involved in cell wall biosynthesis
MKPGFSIIIPTYNTLPYLKLCLQSLKEHSGLDHQLIVFADGCSDGTLEFLKQASGVRYAASGDNLGICTATNRAASMAERDWLFFINNDVVAAPGWDLALLQHLAPGRALSSVQVEPGWVPVAGCHIEKDFGRTWAEFRQDLFLKFAAHITEDDRGHIRPGIHYPFLIGRRLWNETGGLDERFNPGPGSDPDLFYRLALRGTQMLQVRDSLFYHFGGRASRFAGESSRQQAKWKKASRNSRRIYALKWGKKWDFGFGEVPKIGRPEKVAIFVFGGIGNMVMALPAISAVRKVFTSEAISLVTQKNSMLELVDKKHFAQTMSFDQNEFQGLGGILKLKKALRMPGNSASLGLVPFPRRKYGLLSLYLGCAERVCEKTSFTIACNRVIETKSKHYLERNLEMLRAIGIEHGFDGYDMPVDEAHQRSARCFLEQQGLVAGKIIGLHPGAGHPSKRWPANSFIALGRRLADRGGKLLVFGGPGEKELVQGVAAEIGHQAFCFWGDGPLGPVLALIKNCRVFVANDSGLAHCAAALGVPTVGIFGPTDPDVCRPYGQFVKIVRAHSECGPCYRAGGRFDCRAGEAECLKSVTVEKVVEAMGGFVF